MTPSENKTNHTSLLIHFIDQCWNERSRTICRTLLAPDYEHHMPGIDDPMVGPDAYQKLVDSFVRGFPDTHFTIEEAFGEGERACVMWTMRGTHLGVFSGIPPTNRAIRVRGVAVAHISGGIIRTIHSMFDNASFASQLDDAPADAPAESWRQTSTPRG